ncbi:MAG: DHH family phosphoesterase [Nanoarchaeota archaeon]|nr:DHH family phosphoesterase [Nanoarchaeota archaeon]
MISNEQILEFRKLLESSERPLFFFDDDPDGLCAFLLLKRFAGKGRGVVVKSTPILNTQFLHKVREIRPDRIFVLDKPGIEQDFVDEAGVQVVWLDHHPPSNVNGVHYFNPLLDKTNDNSPTSYWAYRISEGSLWVAMAGCVADWFVPDFASEFSKQYPDLLPRVGEPGFMLFDTGIGKLARIISSLLKGATTDVYRCISALEKIREPEEILEEKTPAGKYLMKYHKKINKVYDKLLQKALKEPADDSFIVFTYPMTKISLSGELANELLYRLPGNFIIIGRVKKDSVAFSIRSASHIIPPLLKEALEGLDGYGGGHEHACGGSVSLRDFPVMAGRLRKLAGHKD